MTTEPLVLRVYDHRDRSLAREIVFAPANLAEALRHLELEPDDLQPHVLVDLQPDEVAWLGAHCGIDIDGAVFHVQLGRGFLDGDRPYRLHTGRELRMMLAGVKPLAVFSDVLEDDPSPWCFPEDVFDPHVDDGTLVKRELVELGDDNVRVLLYALAAEAWRVDAYILLRQTALHDGWSDALTRMEGALLGYAHWQNDAHLARLRRARA